MGQFENGIGNHGAWLKLWHIRKSDVLWSTNGQNKTEVSIRPRGGHLAFQFSLINFLFWACVVRRSRLCRRFLVCIIHYSVVSYRYALRLL